ncbi:unnamed protein product [Medioppia subpectinata]|uniref:Lipase domain-containing protein n=1 Tax=Medioppia subpectinata TaxID=1979941 RepID=A0A7R9KCT3_9ACAR|nr:unnamed protein product [Medioppia subpectinata]CAG2101124.1 unnamed protein product [Medioppia subpectinata]
MTDFILSQLDVNVFCVDWSKVAADVLYFPVVPKTQVVGQMVGYFINRLIAATGVSLNDIHLIGHSMGAHVVGFAGQSLLPNKVGQISGLDPAGPGYGNGSPRLSKNDAQLVVCTHTTSGIVYEGDISITGFLGNKASLGHYDFRVNGGNYQPKCTLLRQLKADLSTLSDLDLKVIVPQNDCQFIAYRCPKLEQYERGECAQLPQPMQFDFAYYDNPDNKLNQTSTPNEMFIETSGSYDYCQYHYQILVEVSQTPIVSEIIEITLYGTKTETTFQIILTLLNSECTYSHLYVSDRALGSIIAAKTRAIGLGAGKISALRVNYMSALDVNDWDLQFILFTRINRDNPSLTILPYNPTDDSIKITAFDPKKPTKFLVHGWLNSYNKTDQMGVYWMKNVTDFILSQTDGNVFCVDWSKVAGDVLYFPVVPKTQVVGQMIGYFINRLIAATGVSLNDIHLIGHSLGAHVVGFAGQSLLPDKVAQISGLDPAGPGYGDGLPRLSKNDAQLVVCTHTSSGILYEGDISITGFLGNKASLGHYDFRVNGGNYQPHCNLLKQIKTDTMLLSAQTIESDPDLIDDILNLIVCSHIMAYVYPVIVPQNDCQFIAYRCPTLPDYKNGECAELAQPMQFDFAYYDNPDNKLNQTSTPNEMFIETSGSYDYCQYHYQILTTLTLLSSEGQYSYLYVSDQPLGSVTSAKTRAIGLGATKISVIYVNYMSALDVNDWDLQFILSTRLNHDNPSLTILPYNATDDSINITTFDPKKPTKFLVHGWTSGYNISDLIGEYWMKNVTDFILNEMDANVISVDWSKVAADLVYFPVVPNSQVVGQMIGYFINRLIAATGVSLNDIHLIGHSMGAHVVGFAGQSLLPNKVAQISGLDPAGPGYGDGSPRLSKNDAQLVVCTHTSSGIVYQGDISVTGFLGNKASLGHYDFRVNGDNVQYLIFCSHEMAYRYPVIVPQDSCQFIAYGCPTLPDYEQGKCAQLPQPMQFDFAYYDNPDNKLNQTSTPNEMFIETSGSYDYCQYHYQILVEVSQTPLVGQIIEITIYGTETNATFQITLTLLSPEGNYSHLYVSDRPLGSVTSAKSRTIGLGTGKISTIHVNYMSALDVNNKYPTDWDLQFILFTRLNRDNPSLTILPYNPSDDSIKITTFDPKKRIKFLAHGWTSGFNISDITGRHWMKNATDFILSQMDGNVFCVDWSKVAADVLYFPVVPKTQVVGQMIGYFINRLIAATGVSLNDIHLIGHSMGAHVMGFAGQSLLPNKVAQISGLDPAGPGYGDGLPRLSKNDAQLVVCTHTSSGIVYEGDISITGFLGNKASLGHYDFRVNGAYRCPTLPAYNRGECAQLAQPMQFDFAYYDNPDNKLNQTSTPNEMFIETSGSYLMTVIVTLNLLSSEGKYSHLYVSDRPLGSVTAAKSQPIGLGTGNISAIHVNYMSALDAK